MIITTYIAKVPVEFEEYSGGGWNLRVSMKTFANTGDKIICETNQTPALKNEDSCVRFKLQNETRNVSFENLGRLIACGAIEQITEKI